MMEWIIILLLVTCGACIALAPMARYLLAYSDRIETTTGLPLP
jgi:methyl coenzyme M reductase beta subunit